jgi:hypothetical protein
MTFTEAVKTLFRSTLLVLVFSGSALSQDAARTSLQQLGQPLITNLTAKQYHAHPNNYDAIQDDDGNLYIGNLWCVMQFDGTLWRKIYLPHGASCTALSRSEDGTIYVGGRNTIGYLRTDSIGRKRFVSLLETLPENQRKFNEVWRIASSKEGTFFSSFESLFFLKKGANKLIRIHPHPYYVYQVLNRTYITERSGLYFFEDNQIQKVPHSEYFNDKFINGITHLGNKLLISTSEEGLVLFDGHTVERWDSELNDVLRSFNPTKIENIANKYIVTSTELNGVIITDTGGNILYHFNKSNGLASNTISGFLIDRNDILWLTSYNGISFIPLFKQVSYIGHHAGVTGLAYSSAVYNNRLYLATSEGLFWKQLVPYTPQAKFQRVSEIHGLVWSLKVIDNKLFCGQAISAIVIENDKLQPIYHEGTWMFHATKDRNRILMGTYSGLHIIEKINGVWSHRKKIAGFNESARCFTTDKLGDIWVSRDNRGIYKLRIDPQTDSVNQLKIFTVEDEIPIKNGNTVTAFNEEIFITTEKGVYHYDYQQEKVVPFTPLNSLLVSMGSTALKKIIPENNDQVWIINQAGGIAKFGITPTRVKLLQSTELLRGNLVSDFEHLEPTGKVTIVGTLEGFALYRQNESHMEGEGLRATVSRIESGEKLLLDGDTRLKQLSHAIPYSDNSLRFTFASNSYQDLNSNQFQYYLEGFPSEKGWSPTTSLPYKEYTNLNPGKYTLHLRTINFENKVSPETTLTFTILPPWYMTWWAYMLYVIAFVFFNLFVAREIRKKIEKEKKRTAQEEQHQLWLRQKEWEEIKLQNEKTVMALEQEKLRIETAALLEKEELLEKEKERERQFMEIEKEKLEAGLRHKTSELTSLTLHITQKNEMITRIASQLKKIIDESKDENTVQELKEIKGSLLKSFNSDQEWKKFTEHFDTVHEGFLKKLKHHYPDLSSSTLKLCAFIKMRLSSKQISTLMNTSPDSVLKARYRLRTKFNLRKDTGLEEFLNEF